MLRTAYLSWEFWVPPLLALITIGAMMWLFSHNQDLLRQHQIDAATKVQVEQTKHQVEQVTAKIQGLASEVRELRDKVQVNTRDVRAVKKEQEARP